MTLEKDSELRVRDSVGEVEWERRVELAACYRIVDLLGWTSWIYNHISARIPGTEHLLINPFGLLYSEVTASNLVKIDLGGNPIGPTSYPLNHAGIVIHTTVHSNRSDVDCVLHTHTIAGCAIAELDQDISHSNILSATLSGRVSYHEFEGVTVYDDEREHLVESLGSNSHMVLRNHGLLTCGRTIAEALSNMIDLERSCEIQLVVQSTGRPVRPISSAAMDRVVGASAVAKASGMGDTAQTLFDALRRKVDASDPSYRT